MKSFLLALALAVAIFVAGIYLVERAALAPLYCGCDPCGCSSCVCSK